MELRSLRERLKMRVAAELDLTRDVEDAEIARMIDRCILEETKDQYVPLKEKVGLRVELFNSLRRLDVLTELLEDETVTEIMVNGQSDIFVERDGVIRRYEKGFSSEERLETVIQHIVGDCNRRINAASPIVDARLMDGSRVCIVTRPVSLGGPVITIRRFPKQRIDMKALIAMGSVDACVASVLKILVHAGYNIFISGGTGSGKTTMLNALSDFVPKDARIVTIEDSAELQIRGVENLVRLEARTANLEGENEITIRDLIKASLRLRPDRIIVGEVRDAAAIDMLSAMGTGHDGSLSTGHANSAEDMLARLETMVLMGMEIPLPAVRRQIASAVDIVIHVSRLRDKTRKVVEICEVKGMEHGEIRLNTLFEFQETGVRNGKVQGVLRKVNDLLHLEKQTRQLKTEFREVMTLVSGSISAGYSLENAFVQTYRTSTGEFPLMEAELQILTNGIACHKRIEQLLMALADRSGVDEIRELAAMIEAAKRYGGNIPYLIRQMVRQMQESELVELEIQTVLAAKKLEGRIMLFVPFGIVLFLRMTNASYMQVLYTTATGRLWMGVSLAGIGLCAWWIEKIIRIEV